MFVIFLISECIMAKMKYTEKHRNSDILPDNENMLFLDRINLNKNIDREKDEIIFLINMAVHS